MRTTSSSFKTIFALASLIISSSAANADVKATYSVGDYGQQFATGLVRTQSSEKFLMNSPHVSFVGEDAVVPKTSSLRGKTGAIEDQGQCGSCWSFALTASLRGTWMMKGSDPGRLSFNYLLNCSNSQYSCEGGDFDAANSFISPKGAPAYGSDGPYTGRDGSCVAAPAVASTTKYYLLGDNYSSKATSFKDIAYVVGVLHRPVAIDIAADMAFMRYKSGVYNSCSTSTEINHMVVIEGYDCESAVDSSGNCKFDANGNLPNGVGTWLIRNSWGTSWGDKGYVTIKATDAKGVKCNHVANDALYYEL